MKKSIGALLVITCVAAIAVLPNFSNKKTEAITSAPQSQSIKQNENSTKAKYISEALNGTYKIEDQLIKLTNGKSEIEIVPDSASKLVTTVWNQPTLGDLNGDKTDDAALILIQEPGGSGTFFYVAANLSTKDSKYTGSNGIFLGDRIKIQSIKIENGNIIISYLDRKENEPMSTEPTVKVTKTFLVNGTSLTEK